MQWLETAATVAMVTRARLVLPGHLDRPAVTAQTDVMACLEPMGGPGAMVGLVWLLRGCRGASFPCAMLTGL